RIVLSFSSLEGLAVNKSLEVEDPFVAILYRTVLNCAGPCVLLSFLLGLCVDLLLCHAVGNLVNLESLVLSKCHLRFHGNLCCKDKRLALLDLHDIDLRL